MRKVKFDSLYDIWPIFQIRIQHFQSKLTNKSFGSNADENYIKNVLSTLLLGCKNILKLKKYNTWIFTSSSDLFDVNGKLYDCVTCSYVDAIPNSLLVIRPHSQYSKHKIWTKRIVSESLLILLVFVLVAYFKVVNKKVPFDKELKIKAKEIDYRVYYYRFLAEYIIFSKLIKWCNIQQIFVNCSYSYFGYIYACQKHNIKVIELQHGIINKEHESYMYSDKPNPYLFPTDIFVFGSYFKDVLLNNSALYSDNQIKILGSNALNLYSKQINKPDKQIKKLREKYDKLILFTGQFTVDKQSLVLIDNMQTNNDSICFLFLARHKSEIQEYKKQFKNVVFYEGDNKFYSLVKQVDFHATVYSTTFLESLSLGVPNILFNIDDYSIKHYKDVVNKNYPFILCSTDTKQILSFIKGIDKYDSKQIKKSVKSYFDDNFEANLKSNLSVVS